jgi:hypothetical protein
MRRRKDSFLFRTDLIGYDDQVKHAPVERDVMCVHEGQKSINNRLTPHLLITLYFFLTLQNPFFHFDIEKMSPLPEAPPLVHLKEIGFNMGALREAKGVIKDQPSGNEWASCESYCRSMGILIHLLLIGYSRAQSLASHH